MTTRGSRILAVFAFATALALVLGLGGWRLAASDSGSRATSSRGAVTGTPSLKPLPAGPPDLKDVHAVGDRVELAEMVARADIVFIGTALAVGGSEVVSPANPDDPDEIALTVHRTRFSVSRALRGNPLTVVDITQFDFGDSFAFAIGEEYLIFAEWRELGSSDTRALVPAGYSQGIYEMLDDTHATNMYNGAVDITALASELASRQP